MAKYISFDFETTMNGPKRHPHPSHSSNFILTYSVIVEDNGIRTTYFPDKADATAAWQMAHDVSDIINEASADFLIGHNMKFDIEYIFHKAKDREKGKQYLRALITGKHQWWDTSIAHYILSGQVDKFPTLSHAANRYAADGLGSKSSYLEDFLRDNPEYTTAECDWNELSDYCAKDSMLTLDLAKAQMEDALRCGKFALIIAMCDALRAIVEMECNGLNVNLETYLDATQYYTELSDTKLKFISDDILTIPSLMSNMEGAAIFSSHPIESAKAIISSSQSLSHLLFGSAKQKEYKIVIGKTKGGLNRWGKFYQKEHKGILPPHIRTAILEGEVRGANGYFSVDYDTLEKTRRYLTAHDPLSNELSLISNILEYREAEKYVSTYLQPIHEMLRTYDTIHHTLHQTSTSTGRLSASNPNFQNQPNNKVIKSIYVPECLILDKPAKVFLEFDYKQLEVIGIAYITGDASLKRDIIAGVDIHSKIGSKVFGRPPTKEERRNIKTVVFAMLYGSGIPNIVKTSGLGESLVTDIVKGFKDAYPKVFAHHRLVMEDLTTKAKVLRYTDKDMIGLTSKTGREYKFNLHRDINSTGVSYRPSWTQVCNYPCQGFATGDIVPMMLGVLLDSRANCGYDFDLRNTVHDSILISCNNSDWQEVYEHCKKVLENPYPHLKRLFGITDFDLPLLVEGSVGPNWGDMTPIAND